MNMIEELEGNQEKEQMYAKDTDFVVTVKDQTKFEWTDDKVAEVARMIWHNREGSEVWTGDLTAELSIIKRYKLDKVIRAKMEALVVGGSDTNGDVMIVNREKFNEFVDYLTNYQAELQSI